MLGWYEWQTRFHNLDDTPASSFGQEYVVANLFEETNNLRNWIEKGQWQGIHRRCLAEKYVDLLADNYKDQGVSIEQIREWYEDPKYAKLLKESGTQTHIIVPELLKSKFIKDSADKLNLVSSSINDFFLNIQYPGEMFPLHRDRIKFKDYNNIERDEENQVSRFLVMLYDQKPGQVFFMGEQSVSWRAGDVINWPHYYFQHHGSANFGYWPRFSIRITGLLSSANK